MDYAFSYTVSETNGCVQWIELSSLNDRLDDKNPVTKPPDSNMTNVSQEVKVYLSTVLS